MKQLCFRLILALVPLCFLSACTMNNSNTWHMPDVSLNLPSFSNPLRMPYTPDKRVTPCLEKVEASTEIDALKIAYPGDPALRDLPLGKSTTAYVINQGAGQRFTTEEGIASAYSQKRGMTTSEEPFNPKLFTAAHKTLPFGTIVRCYRKDTGESVNVVINDRGPFVSGRIIDLSQAAGDRIHMLDDGLISCAIEVVAYPYSEINKEANR
jgi:rare lipoprotein A